MVYLISFLFHSQVKQESLGISTKMFLKVDVESGKIYFKKSKDGPEDKYYVHNKSKASCCSLVSLPCTISRVVAQWMAVGWSTTLVQTEITNEINDCQTVYPTDFVDPLISPLVSP